MSEYLGQSLTHCELPIKVRNRFYLSFLLAGFYGKCILGFPYAKSCEQHEG